MQHVWIGHSGDDQYLRDILFPFYNIGLGLWEGEHQGFSRKWLRWLDSEGTWIPTPLEQSEAKVARLAQQLRELGIDPDVV